nr:bis(5'-nucleosyl)-tetraphosphatase (symmetrical) YqeK [Lactobacillus mulieris]
MNKGGCIVTDFLLSKTFSNLTVDELVNKVQANMDEARFRHCQGVSITARKLAKLNNYDEDKAALAGFIHDYAKQVANEEFIRVIKDKNNGFDQDLLNWNRAIWHGIVGTYFIKRELGITDSEILTAIRRHTTGDVEMTTLDKIVFVADYIEPGRSFSGVDEAREVTFANLDDGVGYELAHTLQFLASNRQKIYPKTLAAYNVWGIKKEK